MEINGAKQKRKRRTVKNENNLGNSETTPNVTTFLL